MIGHYLQIPTKDLQLEAFRLRKLYFGNRLTFSIPGTVTYQDGRISSQKNRFPAVSVTGPHCALHCEHCKGKLLESMIPLDHPEEFSQTIGRLRSQGALGILISGGANPNGEVPLDKFIPSIQEIKKRDPSFKFVVHTGLINREVAMGLKEAGVDQILIDVIGDDATIQEIYHLNKRVQDYEETLWMLKEIGHRLAPHIIIGHHFGEIRGEWKALEIVTQVGVETLVLVVLKPLRGKNSWRIPTPEEVSKISAIARLLNPTLPIRMGCIRPAHPSKAEMEKGAIDSGVNTLALPLQGTIEYVRALGLETQFIEMCCSLI